MYDGIPLKGAVSGLLRGITGGSIRFLLRGSFNPRCDKP